MSAQLYLEARAGLKHTCCNPMRALPAEQASQGY